MKKRLGPNASRANGTCMTYPEASMNGVAAPRVG